VGGSETAFESDDNEVVLALATGELIPLPALPSAWSPTAFSTKF